MADPVPFKEYFEALRAADLRAVELTREWTKERLESHNNLLDKWRDASDKDRANFVSAEAFNALKAAFDVYKEITAKALALAEGKTRGFNIVRGSITFVAGLVVALLAAWAAVKGVR